MSETSSYKVELSEDSRFCKIRASLLLSFSPLKGDLYIRLSNEKFVKLFSKGDSFEISDLDKYTIKKGIEYLYVKKEELREFLDCYNVELFKYLKSTVELKLEQSKKINKTSFETIQESYDKIGFTKEVQELTKTQAQLMVKSVGNSPSLKKILSHMDKNKGGYLQSHSWLTGYICCSISFKLGWGSTPTFYKLNLAAILHDLSLSNPELAQCDTIEEARSKGFTEDELLKFKRHPEVAAELATKCKEVPLGVGEIISQHHEKPDGSGFPKKVMHNYISPLSCVFMIAHAMSDKIILEGDNFSKSYFLSEMKEKYTSIRFRKILEALELSLAEQ